MTVQLIMFLMSLAWVAVHYGYFQLLKKHIQTGTINSQSLFVKIGYYIATACIVTLLFFWFSPYTFIPDMYKDILESFLVYFVCFFLSAHHFVNNSSALVELAGDKKWYRYIDQTINFLMQWFPTLFLPFFMTKFYSIVIFVWPSL